MNESVYSAVIRILLRTLVIGTVSRMVTARVIGVMIVVVIVILIGMDEAVNRRERMQSGMRLMASLHIMKRG
jgi:hypothetical protein